MKEKDNKQHEAVYEVHYCVSPLRDSARVWVGDDPSLYVDCHTYLNADASVAKWFEKYGKIIEEEWAEYYPAKTRRTYINVICKEGYTEEEAEEIIQYLPQTDGIYMSQNVPQMIKLWKSHAPKIIPNEIPEFKRLIVQKQEDFWEDEPYSPRAAAARREGWLQGRAELVTQMSEKQGITLKEAMNLLDCSEKDQAEIVQIIEEQK